MDESLQQQIRRARGKFVAMACTFFLGVFNDNFFKQAALVLAVAAGRNEMQGYSLAVFTLPFIVFAAPAGWVADRFSKRSVLISAKVVEFVAMLFGAAGICSGNWWLIFAMLATMGLQATFFSPALNGSIPELYPAVYVTKANAVLRMIVTAAILTGVAMAGIALDRQGTGFLGIGRGRLYVAGMVIGVSLLGVLVSLGVVRRPAADPTARFPWSGPVYTVRQLAGTLKDPLLAATIFASVFIWFVGSLGILIINPLGIQQFFLSKSMTSYLIVDQMVGLGVGGLISGRIASGDRWSRILGPAGMLMGVVMLALATVPRLATAAQVPMVFVLVGLMGIFGGMFLIPVESFIQVRPLPDRKGAILAAANFVVFAGILISGLISNVLNAHLSPTNSFGVVGVLSIVVSAALLVSYRKMETR
jgi:MFS family permease